MLSASGLLYNWRSRGGRSHPDPDPSLVLHSPGDPHARHPRRHRGRRHRRPVAEPQPDHPRRLPLHHPPSTDHEPAWLDSRNDGEFITGSTGNGGSAGSALDRLRLTRNDQLPGVVLQARARLQERLRGISLSGSSQSSINSGIIGNEVATDDDRINQTDNGIDWFELGSYYADEIDDGQYVKPPGLSAEAFHNLQLEVYQDGADSNDIGRAFLECSICLEKYMEGDKMIQLSCRHRFHPACLEPWVKTCGDCPYCRTRI